jgi:hypothetical protein
MSLISPRFPNARSPFLFALLTVIASLGCAACGSSRNTAVTIVSPPSQPPQLFFACCDQGLDSLKALSANPQLFSDLRELHAGLAVALDDLGPERARFVQQLNESGIPAVAWLVLPRDQGYYVNARNAPQTAARFAQFETWTQENHLRWQAVGLDIEANFEEWKTSKWGAFRMILFRSFDRASVIRARQDYSALIQQMHAHGYSVQTYQMIFLADERRAHSTLLERIFGFVEVRGDDEVLMAYSNFNHKAGSAMVWNYGPDAQTLAVGSTLSTGDPQMDAKFGPLNWNEFSNDLRVAAHFSREVGVYSLEGCLRQNFLPQLKTLDWNQAVTLPTVKTAGVHRFRTVVQFVLWTFSHLLLIAAALAVLLGLLVTYRHSRAQARAHAQPNTNAAQITG